MAQNIDINVTVEAWADIVIKNWRRKITELDIGVTGALYDSFQFEVLSHAGGNPERIDFAYEYYGRFVDMGVGRGVYVGNPGDVKTSRKAKKWYSPVIYAQTQRLSELLAEKYSIIGAAIIKENIYESEKRSTQRQLSGGDVMNRRGGRQMYQQSKSELSELDRVWMRRNGLLND